LKTTNENKNIIRNNIILFLQSVYLFN